MKPKYQLQAKNETGDKTIDIQSFTVPDSSITAGSGIVNIATATGDVTGPSSSTDNAIARFDSTTGKVIQNSTVTISDAGAMSIPVNMPISIGGNTVINDDSANVVVGSQTAAHPVIVAINGVASLQVTATGTLSSGAFAHTFGSAIGISTVGFAYVAAKVLRLSDGDAGYGWMLAAGDSRVAADVTTVSITPAAITGLSATLVAGRTYSGRLVVMCAAATAADGFRFDFDGGAATATNFRAMGTIADTASVRPLAMTSALATDLVDTTTTGDAIAVIDFTITCNAAGTFIPRFAKEADAAGATNTVYRGSYMLITDVV